MNEAIERAINDIAALHKDGLIDDDMKQRGFDFVGQVFQADTVYASIAPDGGDLLFYWVAGDQSITADLYGNDEDWYCARTGKGERILHSGGTPKWMWRALDDFSRYVENANPHWREQER